MAEASWYDRQFGLLIGTLASTGCRPSQFVRCRVGDLLVKQSTLIVPASAKGKTPTTPQPVSRLPLDPTLIRELAAWAAGKPDAALLFALPLRVRKGRGWQIAEGKVRPWTKGDWNDAARAAGSTRRWRVYDLRHARIVRLILGHVPIGAIAELRESLAKIIEGTYERWIGETTE